MTEKKIQGECKQSQEPIHHSAYIFYEYIHRTATVLIPQVAQGRGIKSDNLYNCSAAVSQVFYLPACVDNIISINNGTHLVALDWNDNIRWIMKKKSRKKKDYVNTKSWKS